MKFRVALFVLAALAGAVLLREVWPKERIVRTEPEIITKWDTLEVTKLDTVEVVLWRSQTDTVTVAREVIVTRADTIRDCALLPPAIGISALSVPQEWGDSLVVRGFTIGGDTAAHTLLRREWRVNYFYKGPLSTLIADTVPPRIGFWPMSEEESCSFWQKVKYVALGLPIGAFAWEIAR